MVAGERTRVTFLYERWRAPAAGIIEAAATLFLLLIAVRFYNAGATAKALVAGGGSLGLLIAPWIVQKVEGACMPVARAASILAFIGAASFLMIALVPAFPAFFINCAVALPPC